MSKYFLAVLTALALVATPSCASKAASQEEVPAQSPQVEQVVEDAAKEEALQPQEEAAQPQEAAQAEAEPADPSKAYEYVDPDGFSVMIPAQFSVSAREGEQNVSSGLVVIAPDGSEYVWVQVTPATLNDDMFASSGFYDEQDEAYQAMISSVERYGGFYMGRYEASERADGTPASVPASASDIWVHIPPQDMTTVCSKLYADNGSVTAFLPWGFNWDATLTWLVHTGCKTVEEIEDDSSSWGNYANNEFADERGYCATGQWEAARSNNIYDLAGNFWEWTQERTSGDCYAARAGGYTIMGGPANGDVYPVVYRSALPGNNHHPNISFRPALYLTEA